MYQFSKYCYMIKKNSLKTRFWQDSLKEPDYGKTLSESVLVTLIGNFQIVGSYIKGLRSDINKLDISARLMKDKG